MNAGRQRELLEAEPGWERTRGDEVEEEGLLERLRRQREEAEDRCYAVLLVAEGGR